MAPAPQYHSVTGKVLKHYLVVILYDLYWYDVVHLLESQAHVYKILIFALNMTEECVKTVFPSKNHEKLDITILFG